LALIIQVTLDVYFLAILETVSSIAKKYKSSVNWIINANQIGDPKKVNVGKELFIPQK